MDSKPPQTKTLSAQNKQIRLQLLRKKRDLIKANWLASLRSNDIPVEVNLPLLETVPSPAGVKARKEHEPPPALPE